MYPINTATGWDSPIINTGIKLGAAKHIRMYCGTN